ncbi:MAG: hypothetical protein ACTHON_18725 [Humibacter sp.]
MIIEVTTTPRETLLWAETPALADELRALLRDAGVLILPANSWELEFFNRIPDDEQHQFDPARITNLEIGANAYDALHAVVATGHRLRWHPWENADPADTNFSGVTVSRSRAEDPEVGRASEALHGDVPGSRSARTRMHAVPEKPSAKGAPVIVRQCRCARGCLGDAKVPLAVGLVRGALCERSGAGGGEAVPPSRPRRDVER